MPLNDIYMQVTYMQVTQKYNVYAIPGAVMMAKRDEKNAGNSGAMASTGMRLVFTTRPVASRLASFT
jgi:hypothetical protein